MKVVFCSVWDDVHTVKSNAKYNPETKVVSAIEMTKVEIEGNVTREYIILPDGTEMDVEQNILPDGETFNYQVSETK